jgi:hypothetical protein
VIKDEAVTLSPINRVPPPKSALPFYPGPVTQSIRVDLTRFSL